MSECFLPYTELIRYSFSPLKAKRRNLVPSCPVRLIKNGSIALSQGCRVAQSRTTPAGGGAYRTMEGVKGQRFQLAHIQMHNVGIQYVKA